MDSIADTIKNRKRGKVPPRSTPVERMSETEELIQPVDQEEPQQTTANGGEAIPTIELAQATLRLEKSVAERLQSFCDYPPPGKTKLSRESLIEALFIVLEQQPEYRSMVVDLAQQRTKQRKKSAKYKRAQSMLDESH
jgi:hypothetical protein